MRRRLGGRRRGSNSHEESLDLPKVIRALSLAMDAMTARLPTEKTSIRATIRERVSTPPNPAISSKSRVFLQNVPWFFLLIGSLRSDGSGNTKIAISVQMLIAACA